MPRILHVVWSSQISGAEKIVLLLAKYLMSQEASYEIALTCHDDKTETEKSLAHTARSEGLFVYTSDSHSLISFAKEISYAIKHFRPNVVHSHDYRATLATAIALRMLWEVRPKHIATIHAGYQFTKTVNSKSLMALFTLLFPDRITVVSKHVYEHMWFRRSISKRVSVIPNPYVGIRKIAELEHVDVREILAGKTYDLIFVGRLVPEKHPEIFCEVCSRLDAKCVVVGDGPMRNELENRYGKK